MKEKQIKLRIERADTKNLILPTSTAATEALIAQYKTDRSKAALKSTPHRHSRQCATVKYAGKSEKYSPHRTQLKTYWYFCSNYTGPIHTQYET